MKSLHEALIIRMKGDDIEEVTDQIASEIGFTLNVNGKQVVTLLCTPSELDAMAIGFLLSEGILTSRESLLDVQMDEREFSVSVTLKDLPDDIDATFNKKTITSGCGQGITYTDAESLKSLPPNRSMLQVSPEKIRNILKEFRTISELFTKTGGVHSAALVDKKKIILFSEDIGRHNAVDKVVGHGFLDGRVPRNDKALVVSGRTSFEIIQKALMGGVPLVVAVGAPSSLAVELARRFNMTLIGFARGGSFNLYSGEERILDWPPKGG